MAYDAYDSSQEMESLLVAILNNDPLTIREILAEGFNPNRWSCFGWPPIHLAIMSGQISCLEVLVTHPSTDVNFQSHNGPINLYWNCQNHSSELTNLLTINDTFHGWSLLDARNIAALHAACYNHDFPTVQLLITNGCIVNIENFKRNTPLHASMLKFNNDIDDDASTVVAYLLAHGADPCKVNYMGNTPFHEACQKKYFKCAIQLLEATSNTLINKCNNYGQTPLMMSIEARNIKLVDRLLSQGAEVDIVCHDGFSTFDRVCMRNDLDILLKLLSHSNEKEPIDILKCLETQYFKEVDDIYLGLRSLSPYYRPAMNIFYHLDVQCRKVHSLASHCRSVIRTQLHKELSSTPALFRRELLNLRLPKLVLDYLSYKHITKEDLF